MPFEICLPLPASKKPSNDTIWCSQWVNACEKGSQVDTFISQWLSIGLVGDYWLAVSLIPHYTVRKDSLCICIASQVAVNIHKINVFCCLKNRKEQDMHIFQNLQEKTLFS